MRSKPHFQPLLAIANRATTISEANKQSHQRIMSAHDALKVQERLIIQAL
jgi:hypothetical protein